MNGSAELLTVDNLRRFDQSPKTEALRLAVIEARVRAQVTRAQVDDYTAPVLVRFGFVADKHGEGRPITRAADLYLIDESAPGMADKLAAFYAELDKLAAAHGYDLPRGYCPALVADSARIKAERELLEHAEQSLGIDGLASTWGNLRAEALELFLAGARR